MSDSWHKPLWAVELTGADARPVLIGNLWHQSVKSWYKDEPTRALLFQTRTTARQWCDEQNKKYAVRSDSIRKWRFRAVLVVETVRRVKK